MRRLQGRIQGWAGNILALGRRENLGPLLVSSHSFLGPQDIRALGPRPIGCPMGHSALAPPVPPFVQVCVDFLGACPQEPQKWCSQPPL